MTKMDPKEQEKILRKFLIFSDEPREDGKYGNVFPMTGKQLIIACLVFALVAIWVIKNKKADFGEQNYGPAQKIEAEK